MKLVGERIGHYRIVEEIGKGGMGIVYKAVHEKLGRTVAIKMLAPHLSSDSEMVKRFLREARLQAELSHPNVVNIFDYIEQDKNVFLVMEYVKGQSLDSMLMSRGRLSVEEVLYIAEGVLQALSFMHKKGIIHRDIKPNNIMISETGVVKVTDFGIARLAEEEASITKVGTRVGTLYYMAPELIKEGKVSPLVDIYALGVTLYQLLAGRVPFTGTTDYEIIQGHLEKSPPSLSTLVEGIPGSLESVIYKAMGKSPKDRFSSADEFLEAIKALRSSTDVEHVSDSEIRRRFGIGIPRPTLPIRESLLDQKVLFIGGAVIAVVILVVIIAVFSGRKRPAMEEKKPPKIPVIGEKESVPTGGRGGVVTGVGTTTAATFTIEELKTTHTTRIPEELKKELLDETGKPKSSTTKKAIKGRRAKKGAKRRAVRKEIKREPRRKRALTEGWKVIK